MARHISREKFINSLSSHLHRMVMAGLLVSSAQAALAFDSVAGIDAPFSQQAVIQDRALHGARGVVSINQAAGDGNLQANLTVIEISRVSSADAGVVAAVPSATLQQISASSSPSADSPPRSNQRYRSEITDGALVGIHGLLQLNQAAGSGNRMANVFVIGIAGPMP